MTLFWIALASGCAALITFFSGFGLGTLLMPVFAMFFPVNIAIAVTAVVHLANNLFKAMLVGKKAHVPTLLRFGLPALLAAFAGALLLDYFAGLPKIGFTLGPLPVETTPLNLVIGALILVFALLELSPRFEKLAFPPNWIIPGGLISGFFGGLSGHQGAFRSAFLIRSGLDRDAFIATSILAAVIVDIARLLVYGWRFLGEPGILDHKSMIATAIIASFLGTFLGARLLRKTSLQFLHRVIGLLLALTGTALMLGWI